MITNKIMIQANNSQNGEQYNLSDRNSKKVKYLYNINVKKKTETHL